MEYVNTEQATNIERKTVFQKKYRELTNNEKEDPNKFYWDRNTILRRNTKNHKKLKNNKVAGDILIECVKYDILNYEIPFQLAKMLYIF